jgi:fido (protein-threonine AMPylation protein)
MKYLSAVPSTHLAPFDYSWVVSLHKEMFGDVMKSAGMIRQADLNLGDPHYNVRGNLFGLLEDLRAWPGLEMPLLEQAVRLHLRAVKIHPFLNGNGRWSRMLANIWLKQNGAVPIHWPEETIGCESVIRTEYINAIKAADAGDLSLLTALHEKYQGSSQ